MRNYDAAPLPRLLALLSLLLITLSCTTPQAAGGDRAFQREFRATREQYLQIRADQGPIPEVEALSHKIRRAWRSGDRETARRLLEEAQRILARYENAPPAGETNAGKREGTWGSHGLAIERRISVPSPVWSVVTARLPAAALISAGLDGVLRAHDLEGRLLWSVEVDGMAMRMAAGDLDGDGRDELVAATFDPEGSLAVIGPDGEILWRHRETFAIEAVATGDLDGDGRAEVLAATAAHEVVALDASGKPLWRRNLASRRVSALAVAPLGHDGRVAVLAARSLEPVNVVAQTPDGRTLWEGGGGPGWALAVGDLDDDGRNEVVITGSGRDQLRRPDSIIVLEGANGEPRWQHRSNGPLGSLAIGRLAPGMDGRQILSLSREGTLEIIDNRGETLFGYVPRGDGHIVYKDGRLTRLLPLSATLLPAEEGESQRIVLGTGLRSHQLLVARVVDERGRNDLASIEEENFLEAVRPIRAALDRKSPVKAPRDRKPWHVSFEMNLTPQIAEKVIRRFAAYFRQYQEGNIEYSVQFRLYELSERGKTGDRFSREQVLQVARLAERHGVPFWLLLGKNVKPVLSLDTAEEVFRVAPNTARGLYLYESFPQLKDNWRFHRTTLRRALELCRRHGKKLQMQERWDVWGHWPVFTAFFESVMGEGFGETFVPVLKTNNSRAHEISLSGLVGLWKSGVIADWGISTLHDMWNFENDWLLHPIQPGDVRLRSELAGAALGARYFRIEAPHYFIDVRTGRTREDARLERGLVHDLLRTETLAPFRPDQLITNPTCVLRRPNPEWVAAWKGRYDGQQLRHLPPEQGGRVFGYGLALQRYAPQSFGRMAYGLLPSLEGTVPATPYGIVPIVPAAIGPERLKGWCSSPWESDSGSLWPRGARERLELRDAATRFRQALERGREELPFRVEGNELFLAFHEHDDHYTVVMMDAALMRARPRHATLSGVDGPVRDALTGERLRVSDGRLRIEIPAGTFRILEVEKR